MALVNYESLMYLSHYGLTEQHATCETARPYFEGQMDTRNWPRTA